MGMRIWTTRRGMLGAALVLAVGGLRAREAGLGG
jgi:hypothetical protein